MSNVSITKLNHAAVAMAYEHNANVDAWNSATDIDNINDDNVREEGIDASNIEDEAVEAFGDGTGRWLFKSSTASTPLGAGANPVLMGGVTPALLTGLVIATDEEVIIRCSAWCTTNAPSSNTKMILYYSPDGATYSAVGVTRRPMKTEVPGGSMNQTYTVTHRHAHGAGTFHYLLYCEDSPGANVTVQNVVLWAQMLRT